MRVRTVDRIDSPDWPTHERRLARVEYDAASRASETFWFDVPRELAADSPTPADGWLVALLPLAATLGERLRIDLPADRTLVRNLRDLMQAWQLWYPPLRIPPLEVTVADGSPSGPGRTAAFFSGGVDSFFTVLRHEAAPPDSSPERVQDLVTVWGFDIPLSRRDAFLRHRERLEQVAEALGKRLCVVATNLRDTSLEQTGWQELYYGSALAAVAHALGGRCGRVLVSGGGTPSFRPSGSHPATDPLLSSARVQIVYDGYGFSRMQRVASIADSDLARRFLHVCWKERSDSNCSRCLKCLRTMLALDTVGVLPHFRTFDPGGYAAARRRRWHLPPGWERDYFAQIRDAAAGRGRRDIAEQAGAWLRQSARRDRIRAVSGRLFGWPCP